jgi:hypothetical protein
VMFASDLSEEEMENLARKYKSYFWAVIYQFRWFIIVNNALMLGIYLLNAR